MFSPSPLDKSCIGPDCSSGRINASNRFPVGMTSLGDENQHIRIQLAVHKYNSSPSGSLNNRCGVTSPFRHSFLSNPGKAKNYENDAEGTTKAEKRNGNQYEGVGAFPTIHLKKRAVRYRPIRRFNNVKISHPELPVNRFLNTLPETCPDLKDLKSSTRSVLDVLEDLSGKKIHAQDDSRSSKTKSKGLGGDCLLNTSALYKPLFVQKSKINTILTRDNTTQTLSTINTDAPSPQNNNSFIRNSSLDPKAELRRKLAKQNNEIFASLSSSISPSFSLKRKIGTAFQAEDEILRNGSATKNPKMDQVDQSRNHNGIEIPKSANRSKTTVGELIKSSRKNKLKETSSPTSPNKDRLTTIFLDMQNTSPKAQIFQNSQTLQDSKSTKVSELLTNVSNTFTSGNSSFCSKISQELTSPFVNGSTETNTAENSEDNSSVKNLQSWNVAEKSGQTELMKSETDQMSKPEFKLPISQVSTTLSNVTNVNTATFQFGTKTNASGFSIPKTSVQSGQNFKDSSKKMDSDSSAEKKDNENQALSKQSFFGSSLDKADVCGLKFEAIRGSASALSPPKDPPKLSEAVTVTATTTPISAPLFTFGATSNSSISTPQPFTPQIGITSARQNSTSPTKPLLAFGQNNSLASSGTASSADKPIVSNSLPTSTTATTPSIQPGAFSFGQKSAADSSAKTTAVASAVTSKSQTTSVSFSPSGGNVSANSVLGLQTNKSLFTFGQKSETSATSSASVTITQEPKFSFAFNQKSDTGQSSSHQESKPKNMNLFSFGQKSITQESQSTASATNATLPSQKPPNETTSAFAQNVSEPVKFCQISAPQITNAFGAKTEASSLDSSSTTTFTHSISSFPSKTSLFGSTGGGLGGLTTQASNGFKASPSSAPSFSFGTSATTQPTPTFGVSSASQTVPGFGTSSAAQSISGFGGSSTTTPSTSLFGTSAQTFGAPSTTHSNSAFPVTSTTQSGSNFGVASTTQSVPAFGTTPASTVTPSFGIPSTTPSTVAFGTSSASQPASGFGAPTTQSTSVFGSPLGFGISTSSHPSTGFLAPTQSTIRFGTSVAPSNNTFGASSGFNSTPSTHQNPTFGAHAPTSTSAFGTSQSSFSQPFDNKPTTSLGQASSIFGQNPSASFSATPAFSSNQNNTFEHKANAEAGVFDQSKIQTPAFGSNSQTFGNPNKFSFGMSTSNATGFTTSAPNTTSPPVFSFGSTTTSSTFAFGSGPAVTSNTQTQFAFKSPSNEPFKFGAATTKEGFGGNAGSFAFGGQMNNTTTEQKPSFSFGSSQVSSAAPFAFGTTPSPSVFSFGSSSSASSGSTFNFGTPTPGGPFGQSATPSPSAPFAVPGTFSIGSGSSQSRPRATSRPRRRP